jgi:hypothetical protein
MGIEEGEEIQTKGIDKLVNKIIAGKLSNIERERLIKVQEVYRTPNHLEKQKISPDIR